ncbi:MAG: hypothetical protein AB9856_18230 [Cellulosilyticaceae bacterium]
MSCCGNNNYYSRSCQLFTKDCSQRPIERPCRPICGCNTGCTCNTCGCNTGCNCANDDFNDCQQSCCGTQCCDSLKESLCRLVNQKAIISAGDCRVCVIIAEVCDCFVKAINFSTGRVLYFNMARIDSVEDILP